MWPLVVGSYSYRSPRQPCCAKCRVCVVTHRWQATETAHVHSLRCSDGVCEGAEIHVYLHPVHRQVLVRKRLLEAHREQFLCAGLPGATRLGRCLLLQCKTPHTTCASAQQLDTGSTTSTLESGRSGRKARQIDGRQACRQFRLSRPCLASTRACLASTQCT